MRLQQKILLAILPTVFISIAVLGVWANRQAIDFSQQTVDRYLHGALHSFLSQTVEPQYELLQDHGLVSVPSFVRSYQDSIAPLIERVILPWSGHVFIVNGQGELVHCSLGHQELNARADWISLIGRMTETGREGESGFLSTGQTDFFYRVERFKPWDWYLIAAVDRDAISGATDSIRMGALLVAVICAGSLMLVLGYLSQRFVVRPVRELTKAAHSMASGGSVTAIDIHSNDELGRLARDMEETFSIIEQSRDMLRAWSHDLEAQVVERTRELAQANEHLRREMIQRGITENKVLLAQRMARLGYWEIDHATRTMSWSDELYSLFHRTPDEIVPDMEHLLTLVHPYDRNKVRNAYAQALEKNRQYDITHRILLPDDSTRHVHSSCTIDFDEEGQPAHTLGTIQDITDSKEREHALETTLDKYRMFVEGTDNLVTQVDASGVFTYLNHAARKVYERDPGELVGTKAFDVIHPDDREQTRQAFAQWFARKARNVTFHNRQISASGKVTRLQWAISIEYDPMGRPLAANAIARDVTAERRAQQKLQQYALKLARSNKEIKSFAYIVSHDLRAPLVNLKGFAAELSYSIRDLNTIVTPLFHHLEDADRRLAKEALEVDIPEALGFIEQSAHRMDRLISQILTLSRLGRRELDLEVIDSDELVRNILQGLKHQLERHAFTVEKAPLPLVQADHSALDQIFSNLLSNAIKYRAPDGPNRITITSTKTEDETLFAIRDIGIGVSPRDLERIFEPFRRVAGGDIPGEGMGLTYVQTLVRRLGGRIWCESEPGKGSTFLFTISDTIEDEAMVHDEEL